MSVVTTSRPLSLGKAAAITGLVAGTLDVFAASGINGVPPTIILRAIASGVLGARAYMAGSGPIWLGTGLQIAMSILIAAIYTLVATRMRVLWRRPVLFGLLYGLGIFIIMNMLVAPLSAATPRPHVTLVWLLLNVAAMLVFGLIVSLGTARSGARLAAA